jgi:ATP-dependent 26S proteasome regulatory subunit
MSNKFKSANKLNNYNKFLSILDKTNKDNNKDKELKNENSSSTINEIIKTIENNYKDNKYNSINFSGWGTYDVIKSKIKTNDVNEYIDYDDDIDTKLIEKKFSNDLKKRKSKFSVKEKINIEMEVNSLDDLLIIINTYPVDPNKEYNININILHDIKEPLIELNSMIGMKNIKINILEQILYFLQDLHVSTKSNGDFMHTVIYGPPGTGKTEIAKIIGKIYSKMGILKSGIFKKVTRSDLVSGYLGQTALKTKGVIKECIGGVLFIDEAYALGNSEKRDSFSKECIDTLCEALSDYKDNLMVIIAGYENDLKECFFAYNQGLDSRFTWRFKTDEYKAEDLKNIFIKKVNEIDWKVIDLETNWFEKNMDYFKFYGRDIELLLSKVKIVHSKRIFCKKKYEKKFITISDMDNGLKLFLDNDEVKSRKYSPLKALASMYI